MKKFIGIDIAKATLAVAVFDEEQNSYTYSEFDNNPKGFQLLTDWSEEQNAIDCLVCLEATGTYGDAVAKFLYADGFDVSIVNPRRIKAHRQSCGKRHKTDREDAKLIAHFAAKHGSTLMLWKPLEPHLEELQALNRRLKALIADQTREKNRLSSAKHAPAIYKSIENHLSYLEQAITELRQLIDEFIDGHPDLREKRELLTSIPGIGKITAVGFLAEVPDVSRFKSAKQLATFAGLTPRIEESGTDVNRQPRMSKMGNKHLRTLFYMPTRAAKIHNPIIVNLVTRLEERGKKHNAIRGAVMRKLLHLAYGVLKTGQPFDPNFINVQGSR